MERHRSKRPSSGWSSSADRLSRSSSVACCGAKLIGASRLAGLVVLIGRDRVKLLRSRSREARCGITCCSPTRTASSPTSTASSAWSLKAAQARGDWDETKALMAIGQDAIIEEVKASGLRGRGGAGFPTGMKWSFMPKEPKRRAARTSWSSTPTNPSRASCKDREIIRHDPHKLIEGALIAGFAMRARAGYIYIRGEFIRETETLEAAVAEAYDAGLLGKNACRVGLRLRPVRPPRRRRLHLRRRDGDAREPRGQEGPAAPEAAVPGRRRPLRLPDHGQQCREHRGRADHPAPRRGLVRELRPREQRGHQAVPDLRPCEQAVRGRGGDERSRSAS